MDTQNQQAQHTEAKAEPQEQKKPYETPALTVHGTVAQLTKNVGAPHADGLGGSTIVFCASDRNAKQGFASINPYDVLARLMSVPVTSWAYSSDASVRHIGPMAQDFMAAFGVGGSDKHIHMADANGVTMAAIQALYAMLQERDAHIGNLRVELNGLKQQMAN